MDADERFVLLGEVRGGYDQQVCASGDAGAAEIGAWLERNHPATGPGARPWAPATIETCGYDIGFPNPARCLRDPDRRHWFFVA